MAWIRGNNNYRNRRASISSNDSHLTREPDLNKQKKKEDVPNYILFIDFPFPFDEQTMSFAKTAISTNELVIKIKKIIQLIKNKEMEMESIKTKSTHKKYEDQIGELHRQYMELRNDIKELKPNVLNDWPKVISPWILGVSFLGNLYTNIYNIEEQDVLIKYKDYTNNNTKVFKEYNISIISQKEYNNMSNFVEKLKS